MDLKNYKVMVVEDNEASRELFSKYLKTLGFVHVIEADNGQSAIKKLYLNKVDLIVCDWRMPEMSGLEFYKTAQRENLLENVSFLMVSAENEREKVIEALKVGIKDYIVKPFKLEIFGEKVKSLLASKKENQ